MALDRMTILGVAPTLPREKVAVPEWGGDVFVRVLSAFERDTLEMAWERTKRVNFRARLAVATVCDEAGVDVFEMSDIAALGRQPSTALTRITDVAFRLNRFTKEDIEDLEKNSENGRYVDSSSGSPHTSE